MTPLALEHGWLRGGAPQRSFAALALAGRPPNPLAPWEPPDVDACLALALQSGVAACGPAAVPVYAAATVRAKPAASLAACVSGGVLALALLTDRLGGRGSGGRDAATPPTTTPT